MYLAVWDVFFEMKITLIYLFLDKFCLECLIDLYSVRSNVITITSCIDMFKRRMINKHDAGWLSWQCACSVGPHV